jgi:hypothetical protein
MDSATQTWHSAASAPAGFRRVVVLLWTLTWCWAIHTAQPRHGFTSAFCVLSVLLACWLVAMPRTASGRLCWRQPHWFWLGAEGRLVAVGLVPVIDLGVLLCLRMSPSNTPHRAAWRWPQWVWLGRSDPVSWKQMRLALNCAPQD